jgi:tetratricopeptide (TPR) repeat protein
MTGPGRRGPRTGSFRRACGLCAIALGALMAHRCASAPAPGPRDHFPLDPREGLAGPFEDAVGDGWKALLAGDAALAAKDFARARSGPSLRAGEIGRIEALVALGHSSEALASCSGAVESKETTLPFLVACGEAEARAGSPIAAYELSAKAAAQAGSGRPGFAERAQKLAGDATDAVLAEATQAAAQGRYEAARAGVEQAIAWSPRSAQVLARAADVECAAGEKERALQYDREALALGGLSVEDRERAGRLALEVGDDALAVSVFDALAAEDARFAEPAAQARLAFRIANWPEPERQASRARRLTRSGAAGLVWWMFPEVRDARITVGVVAADVLERRDSRPMMRAVSLGLLDVDPETHRARPDAPLTRAAAAQLMLRLTALLEGPAGGPACLRGSPGPWRGAADAIRLAARCGLLSELGGALVSGPELTRGLDRLRSLLSAGEGHES